MAKKFIEIMYQKHIDQIFQRFCARQLCAAPLTVSRLQKILTNFSWFLVLAIHQQECERACKVELRWSPCSFFKVDNATDVGCTWRKQNVAANKVHVQSLTWF